MSNEPTLDLMHTENTALIPATTFPALHAGHSSSFDDWWNDQENGCPTLVLDNDEQFARAVWDAAIKSTNTMSNEPTPRTDAIRKRIPEPRAIQDMICLAFDLERELAEATKQRDALAEALQMITSFDYTDMQCDNGYGCRSVANEALQSLTNPNEL